MSQSLCSLREFQLRVNASAKAYDSQSSTSAALKLTKSLYDQNTGVRFEAAYTGHTTSRAPACPSDSRDRAPWSDLSHAATEAIAMHTNKTRQAARTHIATHGFTVEECRLEAPLFPTADRRSDGRSWHQAPTNLRIAHSTLRSATAAIVCEGFAPIATGIAAPSRTKIWRRGCGPKPSPISWRCVRKSKHSR